jgi:hypothetical protein
LLIKNFSIVISILLRIFSSMFTVCYRLKILSASLLFKFNQIKPVLYIRWCVWDCSLIFFNENLIFFSVIY